MILCVSNTRQWLNERINHWAVISSLWRGFQIQIEFFYANQFDIGDLRFELLFIFFCIHNRKEKYNNVYDRRGFELLFLVAFYFLLRFDESIGKCIFRRLCVNGFESSRDWKGLVDFITAFVIRQRIGLIVNGTISAIVRVKFLSKICLPVRGN